MFKTRLISGIFLVIAAFLTIYASGDVLLVTLLGVSVIGLGELYRTKQMTFRAPAIVVYLAAAGYFFLLRQGWSEAFWMYGICLLIVLMSIYVFTFPRYKGSQMMMLYFGFYYVAVMLSFIYRTRILPSGEYLVWLIFLCSWGCDTCAYCVGMLTKKITGNHQMAPQLSPKKSIEGGIGGILGAALLGALYAVVVTRLTGAVHPAARYACICGAGAVIAQVGDLAASAIKRDYDMKDYGNIIPGHGGILDRFDSVIFTAPVIYYLSVALLSL